MKQILSKIKNTASALEGRKSGASYVVVSAAHKEIIIREYQYRDTCPLGGRASLRVKVYGID